MRDYVEFGEYELLEERVDPHGLFEVYQARDVDGMVLLRVAALAQVQDVLREDLSALVGFEHPAVHRVVDVDTHAGQLYVVQPWIDGVPLRTLMDGRRWELGEAAAVLLPTLEALEAAHRRGLVHGVVTPDTIFVAGEQVLVADFGLSRALRRSGQPLRTLAVSPEQAQGRPLTPASDLFQVGLVLFELLAGRFPALGSVPEIIARTALDELDRPQDLGIDEPSVVLLLERALARQPEDRWPSAERFAMAWRQLAPSPPSLKIVASRSLRASALQARPPRAPSRSVEAGARPDSGAEQAALVPWTERPAFLPWQTTRGQELLLFALGGLLGLLALGLAILFVL